MRRPLMSRLHENTIPSLHVQVDPGMRPGLKTEKACMDVNEQVQQST